MQTASTTSVAASPLDLIDAHEGREEITYSLRTKDRPEAERAARKASVQLDEAWEAMRKERQQPKEVPTSYDLVEVGGKVVPVPPPARGWPKPEPIKPEQLAEYDRDRREVEEEAAEAAQREEWAEQEADEQAERLIQALRRAGVTLPRIDGGVPAPSTTQPIVTPKATTARSAEPAATLESLIPHWERLKKPNAKTVHSAMRAVAEFKDPDVRAVSRRMVIAYRDRLLEEGKAVSTINTRLSFIRILLGIAKDRGLIEVNHAEGTQVAPDKRAVEARIPYTPAQAEAVLFTTAQFKDTHPARYWLPRLAKWTGGRLNELHQLRRSDVQARDGSIRSSHSIVPALITALIASAQIRMPSAKSCEARSTSDCLAEDVSLPVCAAFDRYVYKARSWLLIALEEVQQGSQ